MRLYVPLLESDMSPMLLRSRPCVRGTSERILASALLGFAAALACGLLLGMERERRKRSGPRRALAAIRTFALTALAGAGARATQQPFVILAGAALIVALTVSAYRRDRSDDPGITSAVAIFVTFVLVRPAGGRGTAPRGSSNVDADAVDWAVIRGTPALTALCFRQVSPRNSARHRTDRSGGARRRALESQRHG